MKKFAMVVVLLVAMVGMASAEINLGAFPLGNWLDANYDAVWSFTTGNIKIVDPSGKVYYDFEGKTLQDFKIGAVGGVSLAFTCVETEKTSTFTKGLTGTGLTLKIVRADLPDYSVEMPKQ